MKYPVISVDPPVPFETWGKRPGGVDSRAAAAHYNVMTWQDLADLGPLIQDVTTPDAVLFLWLCQPLLLETLAMAKAWGFTYKTKAFSWVKLVPQRGMTMHVGMGYWTRANTEDVLLFTRGKPKRVRKDVGQMITTLEAAPNETPAILSPIKRHSAKPEAMQDAIERLVSGPYLELFARRQRLGWRCLGNEIDGLDIREALARLATEPDLLAA